MLGILKGIFTALIIISFGVLRLMGSDDKNKDKKDKDSEWFFRKQGYEIPVFFLTYIYVVFYILFITSLSHKWPK